MEEETTVQEKRPTVSRLFWDMIEGMFMGLYDGVRRVMSGRLLFALFAVLIVDGVVNLYVVNHALQNYSLWLIGVHLAVALVVAAICFPFAKAADVAGRLRWDKDKVPEDAKSVADGLIRLIVAFVTGMLFFHIVSHVFHAERNSVAFWFAILAFAGGFGIGYLRHWESEVPYKIMAWLMIMSGIIFTVKLVNPYMHDIGEMGVAEDLRASAGASGQFWAINNWLLKLPGVGLLYLLVRTVWWVSFFAGALSFKKMGSVSLKFARTWALITFGVCTIVIVVLFMMASGSGAITSTGVGLSGGANLAVGGGGMLAAFSNPFIWILAAVAVAVLVAMIAYIVMMRPGPGVIFQAALIGVLGFAVLFGAARHFM